MSNQDLHARIAEKFSAYVDGELPPEERSKVDDHLSTCIQCRTNLQRFRRTLGSLASLKRHAPPTFLPDIQQQINRRSRGRFFGRRWMLFGRIPFEWVSLTMIVAMLVYYIVSLQGAPTGVSPVP